MRYRQIALTLAVVAAILLFDFVLSRIDVRYLASTSSSLLLTQIVAQVALSAAWICLGPQRLGLRIPAAALVALAAFGQLEAWGRLAVEEFQLSLFVELVVVMSGLTVAQLAGFRLTRSLADATASEAGSPIPQFSISQMLFLTAAIAVVVAGLERIANVAPGHRAIDTFGTIAGAYFAATTLASLMAVLSFEQSAVPTAAVVVASTALGLGIALAMHRNDLIGPAMLLMGGAAAIETTAFGLARRRGYRFCRPPAEAPLARAAGRGD